MKHDSGQFEMMTMKRGDNETALRLEAQIHLRSAWQVKANRDFLAIASKAWEKVTLQFLSSEFEFMMYLLKKKWAQMLSIGHPVLAGPILLLWDTCMKSAQQDNL